MQAETPGMTGKTRCTKNVRPGFDARRPWHTSTTSTSSWFSIISLEFLDADRANAGARFAHEIRQSFCHANPYSDAWLF